MARPRTVLVPTDLPLVYDGAGWRFGEVPPDWWLELTEPEIADAAETVAAAPVVIEVRRTSCRPGTGPCRRRHKHASRGRAAA
jgi:hypothetical protein